MGLASYALLNITIDFSAPASIEMRIIAGLSLGRIVAVQGRSILLSGLDLVRPRTSDAYLGDLQLVVFHPIMSAFCIDPLQNFPHSSNKLDFKG